MSNYYNTNDAYGMPGPFESDSRETLADEMTETFRQWANEAWDRLDSSEGVDYDNFISTEIDRMRSEFISALEER